IGCHRRGRGGRRRRHFVGCAAVELSCRAGRANELESACWVARQLQRTKAALDKYRSVKQAIADGYAAASACAALPPETGGESSHSGAMGIHFVSKTAMNDGKLDPTKPEILLYAPVGISFKLVGAEYFKPDADQKTSTDDDRPMLFGRAFDGPM